MPGCARRAPGWAQAGRAAGPGKGQLRGVDLGSGTLSPQGGGERESKQQETARHVPAKLAIEANPKGSAK